MAHWRSEVQPIIDTMPRFSLCNFPRSLQNNYLRGKIGDLRNSKFETEKALDELHDRISRAVAAYNGSGEDYCDENQTLASLTDLVAEHTRRAAIEAKMPFTNDTDGGDNDFHSQDANEWLHLTV